MLDRCAELERRYDAAIRRALDRARPRTLPEDFPRPRLPAPLLESIRAAAKLADPAPLAEFYCERMPRMLVEQLLGEDGPAQDLLWMPLDASRLPRLATAVRALTEALARPGTIPDLAASPSCAARFAAATLLGSGLPMVGAYPAERALLAEELTAGADRHERFDLRLSGNLVHEMCHGARRERFAAAPAPWLVVEAAAAHLGAAVFSRHVHPEVPGEAVPGIAPFAMVGEAFARIFAAHPLWSLRTGETIEAAFGERAGRVLAVAGWQDWLRRSEPPFARDATRGLAWVKLADSLGGVSPLSPLLESAASPDGWQRAGDIPDLLDAAAAVPWRELPWWREEPAAADETMARHAVRAMFQVDVLAPTFQTHPYRPARLHLDAETCSLTRERAEQGVGPGEPPEWIVPPPLCRRLVQGGVRHLAVSGSESAALLARLLEDA